MAPKLLLPWACDKSPSNPTLPPGAAFLLSTIATSIGAYLPVGIWAKAFLGTGFLFTVSSCFVLAKTLRDEHEAERFHHRLEEAQAEKILRDVEILTELGSSMLAVVWRGKTGATLTLAKH